MKHLTGFLLIIGGAVFVMSAGTETGVLDPDSNSFAQGYWSQCGRFTQNRECPAGHGWDDQHSEPTDNIASPSDGWA